MILLKKGLAIGVALTLTISAGICHDGSHENEPSKIPTIQINPQEKNNPWTHLVFNNNPEQFQFAIVTDRTGSARSGVFEDAVKKLNLLQPEFVMSVGDLIEGYTTDREQLTYEWDEFDGFVDQLDMPFFYVAGNHDYTNSVMADIWKERYGESYYHFVYQDVLFVMLNSNDAQLAHHMTEKQIEWLEKVLNENPDPKWTLVFVHAPLWDSKDPDLWPKVDQLLKDRKYTVFSGHQHQYTKHVRNDRNYYSLATTGGGSPIRGPRFGEFDHVMWVTMTEEGPILANLLLEGIWDDSVRTKELRSFQNEFIDGGGMQLMPIIYQDQFKEGSAQLRLKNDSNTPLELEYSMKGISNIQFNDSYSNSITIPPNELKTIDLEFSSQDEIHGDQSAMEMHWNLSFEIEQKRIEWSGVKILSLIEELPVLKKEISIDGDLADWGKLRFEDKGVAENKMDHAFKWDIAYQKESLYIAIEVFDDQLSTNPEDAYFMQDNCSIILDARPASIRNFNTNFYGYKEDPFLYMVFNPHLKADQKNDQAYALPEGGSYELTQTSTGYIVELSIPASHLDKMACKQWDHFRINIGSKDRDPDEPKTSFSTWKKTWNSRDSYPASGSFYRAK